MDQSPAAAAQRLAFNKQALISAVSTGDTETVVDLLDGGIPIDTKGNNGMSLLHGAAGGGHVTTMRLLIRRRCDVDSADCSGLTPLHWAATNGQTKAVRELIRNGAAKSVDAGGFGTPLHQAAKIGHVETVVAMLEEGCPINIINNVGATVLHYAAEGGHVEMVRELVARGCDVNAVKANGCTPLHLAAAHGKTEVVRELIKLGAVKNVDAGVCGTPLHSAALGGNVDTVEALLEDESSDLNMPKHKVTPSRAQESEYNLIGTCDSVRVTPIMSAVLFGQVEMFKFLASKGGAISDIDAYSLSTLEHCFVGGQASKLSQFCEACGIEGRGEGLWSALASLITQGLIDEHKVLCLCAISGDSLFLDDQFIDLVARDACTMPAAMKCAKFYFFKGVPFLNQLSLPDGSSLNPLHMALLSFKCFKMGFAGSGSSLELGAKDHTIFITKLLFHPVLKKTVNEHFPNGLSPLDLARQFELHHIAALIEGAGGRPGVWADIPNDVFLSCCSELFTIYSSLIKLRDTSQGGHEAVKKAVMKVLGVQTVDSVVHVADDSQLVKEQILGQCPDLGDVVMHVIPRIHVKSKWKEVGLALGMKKNTVDEFGQQFSKDDDCYLETLSYCLEHGSSVTWKTLLDVLGRFETWHTVNELTDKILSVLEGGFQLPSPSGSTGHTGETSSKRTAQLTWPPAKWRRTADAQGVPCRRKQSSEGDIHDQPPAKIALVVNGGAVAAERGSSICEATPVQVVQKHAKEFLKEMDCKVVVTQLRVLELIPERVECNILQSKSKEEANAHCLKHLKENADEETMREVFRIASEVAGYRRMNTFAAGMLRELQ